MQVLVLLSVHVERYSKQQFRRFVSLAATGGQDTTMELHENHSIDQFTNMRRSFDIQIPEHAYRR